MTGLLRFALGVDGWSKRERGFVGVRVLTKRERKQKQEQEQTLRNREREKEREREKKKITQFKNKQ